MHIFKFANALVLIAALLAAPLAAGFAAPVHSAGTQSYLAEGSQAPCPHHSPVTTTQHDVRSPDGPPATWHEPRDCIAICCAICIGWMPADADAAIQPARPPHRGTNAAAFAGQRPPTDDPPPRLDSNA